MRTLKLIVLCGLILGLPASVGCGTVKPSERPDVQAACVEFFLTTAEIDFVASLFQDSIAVSPEMGCQSCSASGMRSPSSRRSDQGLGPSSSSNKRR